jgi:hypothetical protein
LISALILYLLHKNVKRALSVRPLVREAPVWLMDCLGCTKNGMISQVSP